MTQKSLFSTSLLLGRIMCFTGCGAFIENQLQSIVKQAIKDALLPPDAELILASVPQGSDHHRVHLTIVSTHEDFIPPQDPYLILPPLIQKALGRKLVKEEQAHKAPKSGKSNWPNILANLLSMITITGLTFLFPPSLLLTLSLMGISFVTTAITSRKYLLNFFHNLRIRNFSNMTTTISLGWFLSLAHAILHVVSMPLMGSFSMIFMNFIMPLSLIACINGMDELKRLLSKKSQAMELKNLNTLFPEMAEEYDCYEPTTLSKEIALQLKERLKTSLSQNAIDPMALMDRTVAPLGSAVLKNEITAINNLHDVLTTLTPHKVNRNLLTAGMPIVVQMGECFPVDCTLLDNSTVVDASLLTGEPQQNKQQGQAIPAGAINLGEPVRVLVHDYAYHSTINNLLFPSNRLRTNPSNGRASKFRYFYPALLATSLLAAIALPLIFGVATLPLLMQNVIGILFAVCPCTIAIAHELPKLISLQRRHRQGITLRDEYLTNSQQAPVHTIVFDKTGTLTTGTSTVARSTLLSDPNLWQKIYLLEKTYGNKHPIALAIQAHYESHFSASSVQFNEIKDAKIDVENGGLEAFVQNKHLQLGSARYMQSKNLLCSTHDPVHTEQGLTPVYVAEDGLYKGVIYIKHTLRDGIVESLTHLKKDKRIILLTGDTPEAAVAFNQQIGNQFEPEDIYAGQVPTSKEAFLRELMNPLRHQAATTDSPPDPRGIWFVGDGLNDSPSCRIVSEKGGISCSMTAKDKSSFFTDLSLNGSLDYLSNHSALNRRLALNIYQNQGILTYSMLSFLTYIVGFSLLGIAIPPFIPMGIMLFTTLSTLFNAYRIQLGSDQLLGNLVSWPKKLLASNFSLALLLGSSTLLTCSILIASIAVGAFSLPLLTFTSGTVAIIASVCTISAIAFVSVFSLLLATSFLTTPSRATGLSTASQDTQDRMVHTHSLTTTVQASNNTEGLASAQSMAEPQDQPLRFQAKNMSISNSNSKNTRGLSVSFFNKSVKRFPEEKQADPYHTVMIDNPDHLMGFKDAANTGNVFKP